MPESAVPMLFTPGPLTTSDITRAAMNRDWGSRDAAFVAMNERVRAHLLEVVHARDDEHVCVPMQGSGTFAVEATLATLLGPDHRLLICVNGAYGDRMATICQRHGKAFETLTWPEDTPVDPVAVAARLESEPGITHVAVVHCETTSGILNPLAAIGEACERAGRALIVDAMSSFGAIDIDADTLRFDAVMASSNKCLEGAPGVGFALVRKVALAASKGNCASLALDLHDQWRAMEGNGQWRFTPPTHVIAALSAALEQHAEEGGTPGRGARYQANLATLLKGMRALGFVPLLPDALQAPIIVTFHKPAHPQFDFERFYAALARRGCLIYPGKLTVADSFRIGCIGNLDQADMTVLLDAIAEVLRELDVNLERAA